MSDNRVTDASENIFADLGLEHPDPELAKADLAGEFIASIERAGLTRGKAASLLGVSSSFIAAVVDGQYGSSSVESLRDLVQRLDVALASQPNSGGSPAKRHVPRPQARNAAV